MAERGAEIPNHRRIIRSIVPWGSWGQIPLGKMMPELTGRNSSRRASGDKEEVENEDNGENATVIRGASQYYGYLTPGMRVSRCQAYVGNTVAVRNAFFFLFVPPSEAYVRLEQ